MEQINKRSKIKFCVKCVKSEQILKIFNLAFLGSYTHPHPSPGSAHFVICVFEVVLKGDKLN